MGFMFTGNGKWR